MNALPQWLSAYSGLDDDALVVLGNRGLLRRAERELAKVSLVSSSADEVAVTVAGTLPVTVQLLPGGPSAARCGCPVAGVCVHLITACLWTRQLSAEDAADAAPAVDVIAEVLSWDPAKVNRAAGIAAVRRAVNEPPGPIQAVAGGSQLHLSWPGAPQVVVVSGGGFVGMLVDGEHSDVGRNAWKLTAIVRLFAAHDRQWPWPQSASSDTAVRAQAASAVAAAVAALLAPGLSQLRVHDADQLTAATQQAQLAKLPLLTALAGTAAATVRAFARRDDDTTEHGLLSALAQAWALAQAVATTDSPPVQLIGASSTSAAELGELVPLSANWWRTPSGSRGITLHVWHAATGEVLRATNGRRPGADPSFSRSWVRPMLWGASAQTLCAGPFRLVDPELRPDGSLSPTERTAVIAQRGFADVNLDELAEQVNSSTRGAAAARFGIPAPRVQLIRPRRQRGAAPLELDEVRQQVIWEVIDVHHAHHRLEFDVFDAGLPTLSWVIAQRLPITAVVVVNMTPHSVFVTDESGTRLIPLTLDQQRAWHLEKKLRTRLAKLREHRLAAPATTTDGLSARLTAVSELLSAIAATATGVSAWQAESLQRRHRELADLGLQSLAQALEALVPKPDAAAVLRAQFLLDRVIALAR
jgi:hypothetical protein